MCGLALPLTSLSLNHNQFHLKHRPKTTFHCSGTQLAQEQPTRKHLKITVATRKASRSLLTCPSRNKASYLQFFARGITPHPPPKKVFCVGSSIFDAQSPKTAVAMEQCEGAERCLFLPWPSRWHRGTADQSKLLLRLSVKWLLGSNHVWHLSQSCT